MAKHGVECARDERPANLLFWFGDGHCSGFDARVAADLEVSIGRTNSERALGFIVTSGKRHVDFVLDRDQVAELAAFLHIALSRLRSPLGRKPDQLSLVAMNSPKGRLFTALQNAAIDAHPGWPLAASMVEIGLLQARGGTEAHAAGKPTATPRFARASQRAARDGSRNENDSAST